MTDYSKITALYSRLSVGDEDRDGGESNSIQNQKIFLENYARGQHLTNIRHYIDDDESGRFFDRSAYSRMMDDVENGKIGVCIMKDLTRWGRDYLQVGNAMEIFRRNNVRFIAVNNGIDSEKPDTLEFAPFINIMSEWYAKDISKKVKTGIKTKGMSGKPIVTEAPYGYVKDPDNKDFWKIDEEAAEVVRLIFRLFIGGKNRNQIAVHLTQEQIPTPTFYMKDRGRGTCKNKTLNEDNRCKWNKATLTNILTRQEYCGDVVNFKTTKHFRDKHNHYVDRSQWHITENVHEPIISRSDFETVQRILENAPVRRPNGDGEIHPLSGLLFCKDCGAKMHIRIDYRNGGKRHVAFCSEYHKGKAKNPKCSSPHIMDADLLMLEDYAMKHGFTNLVHFTDDGWSGATFDRPSWNRLVEGVKNGEITACICKDMSRIGRDHLQVGFFTDILFREKEVRFIAINNGIDSDRQETSEFAPFLNIMNEWFVRDTSKKIKAVLKSRGSSGNAHTSNIPPYGYLKDPENPDHWIIDEEAAEVVRRIYRMTIEGKGPYQIARELSEEKIERPSYYLGKKGLGNHASNYDKENPYMWRGNQVTTLIARPEYIGKTVNFRTFKNSYKDKKTKRADKEDWVVFDDTQEPIVDEETWLLAQKLRQNVRKADPMGEPNVLTGKIYCADCGAPMYNHRQRKGRERIYYTAKGEKRTSYSNPADCYECSTYNLAYQKYDRHCTCHHISTKALKSIILKTIQETCHYVSLNEREFVYSLQEESAMKDIAVSETVKNRIERNQKRVHELDMLIRKIYEDNVIGRLPDRLFQSMLTDYENEQNELNKIIETDTADMQRIIGGQNNVERFLKLVKKYENITELTPAMINEFIDKILVHEPQGKGADRTTEVEIYLNYVGQFQVPVEQHEPTEEERIAAEKEAERLRRKRESNRKYMKKIREKSKEFAEHERIAEEKSSDSNVCVEQNATSKSNRQKVKGEKIA